MTILASLVMLTLIIEGWSHSYQIKKLKNEIEEIRLQMVVLDELQKRK